MCISLNIASRNKHIPEVEQYIRKVEEMVRAIANSLPFKHYLTKADCRNGLQWAYFGLIFFTQVEQMQQ